MYGPVMLVEPGHTMYTALTREKIDRIIDEHLIGGTVVEEYCIPDEAWGDPIVPASVAT
jgi:(2Fe-2S) ferredoxin